MKTTARIEGVVTYREGDGVPIDIRKGPVDVEESFDGFTLSWHDGDTVGATTLPKPDFQRFIDEKAIVAD